MSYFVDTSRLPQQLRSLIDSELQSNERIAWLDQPIPGRLARTALPIVLFGIPWTAFAIFWTVGAAWGTSKATNDPGIFRVFPLFGLPFILVGLGMLSRPFWVWRSAKRSAYVLTDRRAILLRAGWRGMTVQSFEPERLTDLRRKQHTDGSGDLVFTQDIGRDSNGHRYSKDLGFLAIRDVKSVEEMVRALVQRSRG